MIPTFLSRLFSFRSQAHPTARPSLRKSARWAWVHRWIGLPICVLLAVFALSGLILNHRSLWADVQVSRAWLPSSYRYQNWNQGLLRNTQPWGDSLLLYGSGGVYRATLQGEQVEDYNEGLPHSSEARQVRAVVAAQGLLYLVTPSGVYRRKAGTAWQKILGKGTKLHAPLAHEATAVEHERFTDLLVVHDTLYALSRSHLYASPLDKTRWTRLSLKAAADDDGKVSAFRLVWLLHSGELFGLTGQLVVDAIALFLLVLSFTGIVHFFFPHLLRRVRKPQQRKALGQQLRKNVQWHERLGRTTFGLALFVVLTGWMLRPPLLIPLVMWQIPAPPFTTLAHSNPWHDRLRMLRYDEQMGDWLLSTSSGFYALSSLEAVPQRVDNAPRVSPMGLNVWERGTQGEWLVGSFSGFYAWHRSAHKVLDGISGATLLADKSAPPFGTLPVSGYSRHLHPKGKPQEALLLMHDKGTPHLPQPSSLTHLPMSLWHIAIELHTGRFFTFLPSPDLWWVFLTGLLSLLVLWSGWKLRRKKNKKTAVHAQ